MLRQLRRKGTRRLVIVLMGLVLVMTGVVALSTGRLTYLNYKLQRVFAPVAIVLGLGTVALAFKPDRPRRSERLRART
jgi:hypothetical protein